MDYINAEEFKKQDEKVQRVLLDWWQPKFGDLATCKGIDHHYEKYFKKVDNYCYVTCYDKEEEENKYIDSLGIKLQDMFDIDNGYYSFKSRFDVTPLFIETQLRNFIEEKLDGVIIKIELVIKNYYDIEIHGHDGGVIIWQFEAKNLLELYWKVAIKIATKREK